MIFTIGIVLIVAGLLFLIWYLKRDPSKAMVSGITFRVLGGVGVSIGAKDWSRVNEDTIGTVIKGLRLAFADASQLGFTSMMDIEQYRVAIVESDGIYKGVSYFHGEGGDLGGDSIPSESTIIVPWGFDEQAVRHEAEHILLFWNNKAMYDATRGEGHMHPILPKLIADMKEIEIAMSGAPDKIQEDNDVVS